ncbi:MAG TPA: hypothetical protein PK014_06060 [Thermoanaerobaculia bacterium]|nr:hypothetical protein [Thermoanaerobaculia bacterium]HUM29660.1 hypothetical protein [Thermoanaerobaculia bacterium]HXK67311.1 hypothetical protein [Thermoanaerobaculia bacterium]
MGTKKIGELLQEAQVITEEQLERALTRQRETGGLIGESLLQLKLVDENILSTMLALQKDVEGVNLDEAQPTGVALSLLSAYQAMDLGCLPLGADEENVTVAMSDPTDAEKLAKIASITCRGVIPKIAPQTQIYRHLQRWYGSQLSDEEQRRREILRHLLQIKYHITQLEHFFEKEEQDLS